MNRIIEIGFKYVGNWSLENDEIDFALKSHSESKNVLYAFINNGEIKYIGKTTQTLKKRLYGYKNPNDSQSTNIKNNQNIRTLLLNNESVDIFILPDNGLLNYGGFELNLAAALEDSLISNINPEWNGGQEEKILQQNDDIQTIGINDTTFNSKQTHKLNIKLGIAYYNQGFINIPIKYTYELGSHGEEVEFFVNSNNSPVVGYINRTANSNGTPRLMGGKELKNLIMNSFSQDQIVEVTILSSNSVQIKDIN